MWQSHLYTTADEARAQEAINDPNLIFQRKYDGERMRIAADPTGLPFGCNRRGHRSGLNLELLRPASSLLDVLRRNPSGPSQYDFDGERIGTNSYVVWDNVFPSEEAPYEERFKTLLEMASNRRLPAEFQIAETAFTPATKRAMLQTAKDSGWEGIMIKRRFAPYFHGRSPLDWKYPFLANVTVRLVHVNATATTQYGSVMTEIRTGTNTTVGTGNVAGGFSDGQLERINTRLRNGEIILADIRYKNWTGRALYQPKFERERPDLNWPECIVTHMRGASAAQIPILEGVQ